MRVGFLFNHDQVHQVAHSLPIALALAEQGFGGEITAATTNERLAAEVLRLGRPLVGTRIEHVSLRLKPSSARWSRLLNPLAAASRVMMFRDNLDFFRSLDVLIVADKAALVLKKVHGLSRPLIVHTRHGAGDRAIGFDRFSTGFDHVFCSGEKIRERLIRDAGVPASTISVVGYPKFDLARRPAVVAPTPGDCPTVLYNPHPSPHLSSWYRHGRRILDFFVDNSDYKLIFAPHVMLFERKFVISTDRFGINMPGRLDARYASSPNIHVDLGSPACTDMTYTAAADIYLGDASSQVYEFLYWPRPCLFVNSHGAAWRGSSDFLHWTTGPVIDGPGELAAGLRSALDTHTTYLPAQQALRSRTFDLSEVPSGRRAAIALMGLMDRAGLTTQHGQARPQICASPTSSIR